MNEAKQATSELESLLIEDGEQAIDSILRATLGHTWRSPVPAK